MTGDTQPGWTTTEFWSRVAVDALALVATLLTFFTGSDHGIQGAEAIVPAAAVLASAAAHAVYAHGRLRLKVALLQQTARAAEGDLRRLAPAAAALGTVAESINPALATRVASAEAAGREVDGKTTAGTD